MIALSFAIGTLMGVRRAEARGIPGEKITDLALVILVSAMVGARILFVIPHWSDFSGDPLGVLRIWEGGLTLYGGVILAVISSYVFVRREGLSWVRVCDALAAPLALGLFIARIGCFLNGCCHGRPTSGPLGVIFPGVSVAHCVFPGKAVLPTQLFDSAFGLVLLAFLLYMEKRRLRDGSSILVVLVGYSVFRFFLDFLRYYENSMLVSVGGISLSVNQIVSLIGILGGVGVLLARGGASRDVGAAGGRRER